MARPCKSGIDYFPLDVAMNDKMKLIEAEFGLVGFAVVVKLWQKIYAGRGYYCEWNEEVALLFSREVGLGGNVVSEIITATLRRGLFDKKLFDKYGILTSEGVQNRYFEATERRKGFEVKKQYLLVNADNNLINVDNNPINVCNNSRNVDNNPQSKVNKSKVNKSINTPEIPVELSEMWNAFVEHRKKLKKPLTDYAADRLLKKLMRLSDGDFEIANKILQQSIDNVWQGVFELETVRDKPKKAGVFSKDASYNIEEFENNIVGLRYIDNEEGEK